MVVPFAMLPFAGKIEMESRVEPWTVAEVLPLMELEVAETVRVPAEIAVTTPLPLTEATAVFEEAQVTVEVMSLVL